MAGKRAFLNAYHWARSKALSQSNIKAGWKATGLWPVSVRKPLSSRQLLQNSNSTQLTELPPVTPEALAVEDPILDTNEGIETVWKTPRKARELRDQGRQFLASVKPSPRDRVWQRKVEKAFDEQTFELAQAKRKFKALEEALRLTTTTRRRKVQLDPNSSFASIVEVRRAQLAAGRDLDESTDSSLTEPSEAEDCIEIPPLLE